MPTTRKLHKEGSVTQLALFDFDSGMNWIERAFMQNWLSLAHKHKYEQYARHSNQRLCCAGFVIEKFPDEKF